MARKFIPFQEIEELATIDQLATMLNLDIKRSGSQLRCECPTHGGDWRTLCISPQVRSRRGSLGVFYCQKEQSGGDRIGLVAHVMQIGQQDAAIFIAQQFGMDVANSEQSTSTVDSTVSKSRTTAPPAREKAATKRETTRSEFDPAAFGEKLQYTDQVAGLGYSEADAKRFLIGFYRGHVYRPVRHPNGDIAGFEGYDPKTGKFKLPPRWLEPIQTNVVALPRRTA